MCFCEATFAGEVFTEGTYAEKVFAEETFSEKTFVVATFAEEAFSSSNLDFRDKHFETMKVEDLERRYKDKYDIDWKKVITQFGIGASVIVLTGTVGVVAGSMGAEPVAAIAFASAKGAAMGCISGAAIGGGLQGLVEAVKSGNISAAQKGVIEGAAEGCMWGAFIGAVSGGWGMFKVVKKEPSVIKPKPVEVKTIGQDIQSANGIPKNETYKVGGYVDNGAKYVTDEYGRIKSFSADLRLTKVNPRGSNRVEQKIGKQMKCGVGGHLIGNQFGGTGGYENLVAMSHSVNSSTYKTLENKWASALREGKSVSVTGDILYSGTSSVPAEFVIRYLIDGVAMPKVSIPNTCP